MIIIDSPHNKVELFKGIEPLEGGLVKGVIDIVQKKIALDAAIHVDLEQYMIELGVLKAIYGGLICTLKLRTRVG